MKTTKINNIAALAVILLTGGVFISNSSFAAAKNFTGAAASQSMGNGGNWEGGAAPAAGDDWIFDGTKLNIASGNTALIYADQAYTHKVGTFKVNPNVTAWAGSTTMNFNFDKGGDASTLMTESNPLVFTIGDIVKDSATMVRFRANRNASGANYINFVVTGDVTLSGNGRAVDNDSSGVMFGGWSPVGSTGTGDPTVLNSLEIKGTVYISQYERLFMNVGKISASNYMDASNYATADVSIKGGIEYSGGGVNVFLSVGGGGYENYYHQTVYHVNGINTNALSNWMTVKNAGANYNALSILVFTNEAGKDEYMYGQIADAAAADYGTSKAKTKVVMNGDGKQTLKINSYFSGGVDVVKGTLVINQLTSGSMGNLLVTGGTFSVNSYGEGTGKAVFDNFSYKGGTIQFGLGATQADKIILNGALTNDSAGKILLDFDLTNLVLDEEYLVMSWTSKGSLTENDFLCITDFSGTDVDKVVYEVTSDALYVTFTAIPEPSAVAAIFGLFAIVLAVYFRRK